MTYYRPSAAPTVCQFSPQRRNDVDALVLASDLDGDLALGSMGPVDGAATVHKIAVSDAMAGCNPDHMPVVLGAIEALLKPEFDLGEMQGTTHCTAPLLFVNGPVRFACGTFAATFGVFGPGQHANGPVGRAIRLAMLNIGGGKPGESNIALRGHPANTPTISLKMKSIHCCHR